MKKETAVMTMQLRKDGNSCGPKMYECMPMTQNAITNFMASTILRFFAIIRCQCFGDSNKKRKGSSSLLPLDVLPYCCFTERNMQQMTLCLFFHESFMNSFMQRNLSRFHINTIKSLKRYSLQQFQLSEHVKSLLLILQQMQNFNIIKVLITISLGNLKKQHHALKKPQNLTRTILMHITIQVLFQSI